MECQSGVPPSRFDIKVYSDMICSQNEEKAIGRSPNGNCREIRQTVGDFGIYQRIMPFVIEIQKAHPHPWPACLDCRQPSA